MAVLSTVSASGAHEVAPVPERPYFELLPPELRQMVYEMAFHGSRVHASLFDFEKPRTQTPALILRHSSHFNLLLTCRKVYNEAVDMFWPLTVLEFAQPRERSKMLAGRERRADFREDTYTHLLCSSLPKALKMKIRHIKGLLLPNLYGEFVQDNPSFTAAALLSDFKNLATCDISPSLDIYPDWYHHAKPINNTYFKDFTHFTTALGRQPTNFLAIRYGIDVDAEIVFLGKTLVDFPTSDKDTKKIPDDEIYRTVHCNPLEAILQSTCG